MTGELDPLERLSALATEVDARFDRIRQRQADRMQCRAGCSACCRARLSITRVEERFLRRGLETLSTERRAELAARTREPGRENCPALDADGRCGIYPFRPLICRSYGLPLRHRSEVPLVRPAVVEACDLNFAGVPLPHLPPEEIFDQTALDRSLEAIDNDYRAAHALAAHVRVPIARILQASRSAGVAHPGGDPVDGE